MKLFSTKYLARSFRKPNPAKIDPQNLMKPKYRLLALLATIAPLLLSPAQAATPPEIINYQGRVAVDNVNFDGAASFRFALVDGPGTTTLWSNDGTSTTGSEPTTAVSLTVTKGLYALGLGDTALANMTAVPASVFTDNTIVKLRVWFDDGTNGSVLLSPDQTIASVGFAMNAASAQSAESVAAGTITEAMLADDAVTTAKIVPAFQQTASLDPNLTDLSGVISGTLSASVNFDRPFVGTPVVNIPAGWMLTGTTETAFTATSTTASATINTGNPYYDSVLAEVDGRPAMAYRNAFSFSLHYAIATDASATSWSSVTVDGSGAAGFTPSLAVVNDRPAISYYDLGIGEIKFAIANNAAGTSWGAPVSVATTGIATATSHGESALAMVNGFPAVCFHDINTNQLKYVIANDNNGATWGTPIVIDGGGRSPSIAIVEGRPALAYSRSGLKFIRANNASGTSWGSPIAVGSGGAGATLRDVNGRPAITHLSGSNLQFVRANNETGSTWGSPVTVDSGASFPSLSVVGGKPAVGYYDETARDVKFALAIDADGATWGTGTVVVSSLGPPASSFDSGYVSMTAANGGAVLSYYDHTSPFSLKSLRIPILESWSANDPAQIDVISARATGVVDGAVTSAGIASGAVTSASIASGAVTSASIADDAVTLGAIADGAVTSNAIANGTITAADLDTGSIGLWDVSGANVYRSTGNAGIGTASPEATLHVVRDGTGESFAGPGPSGTAVSSIASAVFDRNGHNVVMVNAGNSRFSQVVFGRPNPANNASILYSDYLGSGLDLNVPGGSIKLKNGGNVGIGTTGPATRLHVVSNQANAGVVRIDNPNSAGFSGIYFDENGSQRGYVGYVNSGSSFSRPGTLQLGTNGDILLWASGGGVTIDGTLAVNNLPFGDYKNVQWNDATGQFYYDNSSRRFKENIGRLDEDFIALLDAEPKEYTRPERPNRWEIGFIAEEFHDLGLTRLVDYEADGETPAGINYEKICLYLTAIAKEQGTQIKTAEAENVALRDRLEKLEKIVTSLVDEK